VARVDLSASKFSVWERIFSPGPADSNEACRGKKIGNPHFADLYLKTRPQSGGGSAFKNGLQKTANRRNPQPTLRIYILVPPAR
jgi:hypothetical protein